MVMEAGLPEWLGGEIVSGQLPWQRALRTTLPRFFRSYTLHDSYWMGLFLEPQRHGVALIRWDTFWTDGRVAYPGNRVAEWPLLLIGFTGLCHADIGLEEDGIAAAWSEVLSPAKRVEMNVQSGELHHTGIEDHRGGVARLIHHPDVALLCLSKNRDILEIPDKDTPD
jgi:hypothetical protein